MRVWFLIWGSTTLQEPCLMYIKFNPTETICKFSGFLRPSHWLLRAIRLSYVIQFTRYLLKFSGILLSKIEGRVSSWKMEIATLQVKNATEPVPLAKIKKDSALTLLYPRRVGGLDQSWIEYTESGHFKLLFRILTLKHMVMCQEPGLVCSNRPEGWVCLCLLTSFMKVAYP